MADPRVWGSVLAGVGVTLACAVVWWAAAAWARGGNSKRFLVAHLGGMGIRLALAGGLSAWALLKLDLRPGLFLAALIGSYVLFLALEVLWFHRHRRGAAGVATSPQRHRSGKLG